MALGKQSLWILGLLLNSCTPPSVEAPTLVTESGLALDSIIEIEFIESAPKDRFVITNLGSCLLEEVVLALDLSQSAGMLIFDTSATGAGVDVFQPFEVEAGDITPLAADGINDGDYELTLRISDLDVGGKASFTIDVDDTLPNSELGQIRVSNSEMSGAIATASVGTSIVGNSAVGNSEAIATEFGDDSTAQATLPACSTPE